MGTTLLEQVDGAGRRGRGADVGAMEQDRRLTDEVVAAIRATGLNRAWCRPRSAATIATSSR